MERLQRELIKKLEVLRDRLSERDKAQSVTLLKSLLNDIYDPHATSERTQRTVSILVSVDDLVYESKFDDAKAMVEELIVDDENAGGGNVH